MTFFRMMRGTSALGAVALSGVLLMAMNAAANEVTLSSSDGTVNLSGTLISFEDNAYIMETGLGQLRVDADQVRCDGAACPVIESPEADVVIAGSDSIGIGMMPLLLDGYAGYLNAEMTEPMSSKPGELVTELVADEGFGDAVGRYLISSTGSSDAFSKLLSKETEIGMSARRIQPDEARALRAAGAGEMISPEQEHIVAVDSLAVITHSSNPVSTLSKEDLRNIYSGRVNNWRALGGPDLPITFVSRDDNSGSRSVFEDRIFLGKPAFLRPDAIIARDSVEVAALVNQTPGAIGYTGMAYQRNNTPVTIVNHCGMPMTPDAFSVKTEEYALQRRLYFYTRADYLPEEARNFMEYATSMEADNVISKAGFVSLGVKVKEQRPDDPRALMLAEKRASLSEQTMARAMLDQMTRYDRLSTTFRFRSGSSQLDERSGADMQRLMAFLEKRDPGTNVLVVGFTDDIGAFSENLQLARKRAEQVRAALEVEALGKLTDIRFEADAYGELAPAFCNTDDQGRAINRRVEIWISKDAG